MRYLTEGEVIDLLKGDAILEQITTEETLVTEATLSSAMAKIYAAKQKVKYVFLNELLKEVQLTHESELTL